MDGKTCFSCQADLDQDAIFCNQCGAVQSAATPTVKLPEKSEPASMIKCPQCQKVIPANIKFCSGCAYSLATEPATPHENRHCPKCQTSYSPDDRFCRSCAFDLSQVEKVSSAHFCTSCGKPFEINDKFCRHCASDLSKSNQTVAVPIISPDPVNTRIAQPPEIVLPEIGARLAQPPITPSYTGQQPNSIQAESAETASKGPHWISPSGAALAVICFFLPWLQFSACGINRQASGAELAQFDGSFWLFPLMGIVSLTAYFIFRNQKTLWKARPVILISSVFALFLLFYKISGFTSGTEILGQRITPADLGLKPHIGGLGTILGFIAAMFGCLFMGRTDSTLAFTGTGIGSNNPANPQNTSIFSGLHAYISSLKPNKAAMLCYVLPLLLPIPAVIFGGITATLFGGIGLVLYLAFVISSHYIWQILILRNFGFRQNGFVRFHAWQSIFAVLCYYGYLLVFWLFLISIGNNMGITSGSQTISLAIFWLGGLGFLVGMIILAVKAYRSETYKVPIISDWAMGRIKQP